MTDREVWVSVFNAALRSAVTMVAVGVDLRVHGKKATPGQWAKNTADEALEVAPEDHP